MHKDLKLIEQAAADLARASLALCASREINLRYSARRCQGVLQYVSNAIDPLDLDGARAIVVRIMEYRAAIADALRFAEKTRP